MLPITSGEAFLQERLARQWDDLGQGPAVEIAMIPLREAKCHEGTIGLRAAAAAPNSSAAAMIDVHNSRIGETPHPNPIKHSSIRRAFG